MPRELVTVDDDIGIEISDLMLVVMVAMIGSFMSGSL